MEDLLAERQSQVEGLKDHTIQTNQNNLTAKSLGRKINLVLFKKQEQKNPQTLGSQRQKLLSRAHKGKTN